MRSISRMGIAVVVGIGCLAAGTARAAKPGDGVSEERLSLPEGPGSLEGIGENITLDRNMGQMQYSVPINVPQGFPGMTPDLALAYSSGAGNSVVGVGWSLAVPFVERLTVRGLPLYTTEDEFSVGGGEELVRVPGTDPPVYRARFEKEFARWTWKDVGTGGEGYWTAEYPDGRIGYFGADATGALVSKARVTGPEGTFRYLLVAMVDRYGHHVDYAYELFGNKALVRHIGWVFTGGTAQYEATFEYEVRTDRLSDCMPGFEELLQVRLSQVNVLVRGTRIRRYVLAYEDPATSGGLSRLASVQLHGRHDGVYPVRHGFGYQRALGVDCKAGQDCAQPYVRSMGSLGIDMQRGSATLVDLDGDALPDVVDTSEAGRPHRIFRNVLQADGTHAFAASFESAKGNQGGFDLASPYVQVLDLNGDGFTDLLNAQTGQVLYNRGTGDWAEAASLWSGGGGGGLPDLASDFDPSDGNLRTVRFLDCDNDKRIDIVRSEGTGDTNETFLYRNTGAGTFALDPQAERIGAGFESDRLELNDMNGDGLVDVVLVSQDEVRYRLNLGRGRWAAWTVVPLDPPLASSQQAIEADLDDLNGDGLADLILVSGNTVRYWVNRNGASLDAARELTSADVEGDLPERTASTTVMQADMNGNGSSDVVWIDASGSITYLELFPARPNLLSRITNALGRVTDVTYASSVAERARDQAAAPWTHPLPFPMSVVKTTDEWDELTKVHTVTTYAYHDGYHDGAEKRFRGYARVEGEAPGDAHRETGQTLEQYDTGIEDAYRAGLLLREEQVSGGRSLQVTTRAYGDCEVAGVPADGLRYKVRHVCETSQEVEHREGTQAPQWVNTRTTLEHDGYGNVTLESNLGVTAMGGGACEACASGGYTGTPCGPQCLGDERYEATAYVTPAGNDDGWLLRLPTRQRAYGAAKGDGTPADDVYSETVTYYDGNAFTGLPEGKADHGTVTRVVQRVDATGKTRQKIRNGVDAHGNVVEALDPLGTPGGDTHRRLYTMDADGLRVARVEILLKDADGSYLLRREVQYDEIWDKPVEDTEWMVVDGGQPVDPRSSTFYAFDEFGRIVSMIRPGDSQEAPTEAYDYDLKSPASRILVHRRTTAGGAPDLLSIRCMDGRGRTFQQRDRIAGDSFQVSAFTVFDAQGLVRIVYDPHRSDGEVCDVVEPDGVLAMTRRHDALGRVVETTWDAAGDETAPAIERMEFGPLSTTRFDVDDTDLSSPHAGTPTVIRRNGLGNSVAVLRMPAPGAEVLQYRLLRDALGFPAGTEDPAGAAHLQANDLLGRVVDVTDPDSGSLAIEYDDAGSATRRTDARGRSLRMEYDGASRLAARWDEADEAGTRVDLRYDRRGTCPQAKCTNVAGRLVEAVWPLGDGVAGRDLHGYTPRGRDAWLGRTLGGQEFEIATSHDAADRVTANTYPTGRTLTVTMDGIERTTGVAGFIDQVDYDDRGLVEAFRLHNGVQTAIQHDARMRLASMSVQSPGGASILSYEYRRDRVGNVLEVTDGRADGGTASHAARYTYDSLYRLVKAEMDPGGAAAETLTYAWDEGNRLVSQESSRGADSPAHIGALAYGGGAGPHAVTAVGSTAIDYDEAGNVRQRGDLALRWDIQGRLVGSDRTGGEAVRYGQDPDGIRVLRSGEGHLDLFPTEDFEVRDGTAFTYVQLDQDRHVRIEEPSFAAKILPDLAPASGPDTGIQPDADGSITAGDAWLLSAVQAGWMTTSTTAPQAIDPRVLLHASARRSLYGTDPRIVYLHTDSLGSTVATTDDQGAPLGRAEFYPFGQVRMALGEGDPHGFTGKEADTATGLLDFGARLLDPVTGRWTAPDPSFRVHGDLDEEQVEEATSAYGYVDGNPANARDPDGEAKVGCLTSLLGRFKTARALMKGSWRPNVLYHYRFNLTPNQKIDFRTAWKMVKTASRSLKVGDTHGAFVPKSRNDSNSLLMETRSAGHALSGYYKTMRLEKNDYRVEHFSSKIAPSLANIAQGISGERFLDIRGMHQLHAVQGMQLGLQETHINQGHEMKALATGGRGQRK